MKFVAYIKCKFFFVLLPPPNAAAAARCCAQHYGDLSAHTHTSLALQQKVNGACHQGACTAHVLFVLCGGVTVIFTVLARYIQCVIAL